MNLSKISMNKREPVKKRNVCKLGKILPRLKIKEQIQADNKLKILSMLTGESTIRGEDSKLGLRWLRVRLILHGSSLNAANIFKGSSTFTIAFWE